MKLNDKERELWVLNDEGLYNWYRSWTKHNKGGMRGFIRENRPQIDAAIRCVVSH